MKLNEYKAYFNLDFDQFIAQHNVNADQIHKNRSYEKLKDVTRVDLNDQFFFQRR